MTNTDETRLSILTQSYWMHFKEVKDLSLYHPPNHPKIILMAKVIEEIRIEIEKLKEGEI